jgi:hypothetical protein
VEPRILLAARTYGAARDEIDDSREREGAGRLAGAEMTGDAAPDLRQHFRKTGETPRLAHLAHPLPVGMIAVLQASGGVAPDRLDVRTRIGGVEHVHIGRRHRERGKPLRLLAAQRRAIGGDVAKTPAMPQPADGQLFGRDVGEAEPLQELHRRWRTTPPAVRAAPRRRQVRGMFCGVRVLLDRHDAADRCSRQQSGQWAFVPSGFTAGGLVANRITVLAVT